ncbi:hypothetical protein J5N97_000182 [Dioscorea zingiberensis]|uniref:Uncharacterized protein n=1 Tax=Dioscorea zingiberensis TaxID=325984 RepID=A0A9D5BSN5_9LILI|nr:hypothetical protein J5N97_000182 [Dioscorea zingiberensis]
MASINLSWFGDNWFSNPRNTPRSLPSFAFIGGRSLSSKNNTQSHDSNPFISSLLIPHLSPRRSLRDLFPRCWTSSGGSVNTA